MRFYRQPGPNCRVDLILILVYYSFDEFYIIFEIMCRDVKAGVSEAVAGMLIQIKVTILSECDR